VRRISVGGYLGTILLEHPGTGHRLLKMTRR
jgi:hypothetical protein